MATIARRRTYDYNYETTTTKPRLETETTYYKPGEKPITIQQYAYPPVRGVEAETPVGQLEQKIAEQQDIYRVMAENLARMQGIPLGGAQANVQWAMGLTPQTQINPQIASQIAEQVRARYAERGLFHSTPSAQAEAEALAKYYAGVRQRALEEQARIRQAQLGALAGEQALIEEQRNQLLRNLRTVLQGNEMFLQARDKLARYYMQVYNINMQSAVDRAEREMMMKMAKDSFWASIFESIPVVGPIAGLIKEAVD